MVETRPCKRCLGFGKQYAVGPVQGDKVQCWICAGTGHLPKPDKLVLVSQTLNNRGRPHVERPKLNHKMTLSAIGKLSTWGKTPTTLDDVQACWRASPDGRRAFFVWKRTRMALGLDRSTHNVLDIKSTTQFDPWIEELIAIVADIAKEQAKP